MNLLFVAARGCESPVAYSLGDDAAFSITRAFRRNAIGFV
jgi:hypothetical protein